MFWHYSIRATSFLIALAGGPRGIRTPDLLNAIETRSQLRYGPRKMIVLNAVDLRGFEPLTSSVRLRRAPNCATGPSFKRRRLFYLREGGMSMKGLCFWQQNFEGGAAPLAFGFSPNGAALRFDNAFGNGQANSQATMLTSVRRFDLIEIFKYFL